MLECTAPFKGTTRPFSGHTAGQTDARPVLNSSATVTCPARLCLRGRGLQDTRPAIVARALRWLSWSPLNLKTSQSTESHKNDSGGKRSRQEPDVSLASFRAAAAGGQPETPPPSAPGFREEGLGNGRPGQVGGDLGRVSRPEPSSLPGARARPRRGPHLRLTRAGGSQLCIWAGNARETPRPRVRAGAGRGWGARAERRGAIPRALRHTPPAPGARSPAPRLSPPALRAPGPALRTRSAPFPQGSGRSDSVPSRRRGRGRERACRGGWGSGDGSPSRGRAARNNTQEGKWTIWGPRRRDYISQCPRCSAWRSCLSASLQGPLQPEEWVFQ